MEKFKSSRVKRSKEKVTPGETKKSESEIGSRGINASFGQLKLHLDRDVVFRLLDLLAQAWAILWRGIASVSLAITLLLVALAGFVIYDPQLGGLLPPRPVEQGSDSGE